MLFHLFKTVFYSQLLKFNSNSHFTSSSMKSRPCSLTVSAKNIKINNRYRRVAAIARQSDKHTKCQKLKSKYSKKYNCSKKYPYQGLIQKSLTKFWFSWYYKSNVFFCIGRYYFGIRYHIKIKCFKPFLSKRQWPKSTELYNVSLYLGHLLGSVNKLPLKKL